MTDYLELWDKVQQTDPDFTSKVTGKGFNATSINPMYLIKKATEQFGPMGEGWGVESIESESQTIGDTVLFSEHVRLWYLSGGERCEVSHWSSIKTAYTTHAGKQIVDEEARKKCRTNATSKCLSLLGFSADVWLKYYDSDEYKSQMKTEHERINVAEENKKKYRELMQKLELKCGCVSDEEKLVVCQWVLDDASIELGQLKLSPGKAKAKLADEIEGGADPKRFLKIALEWMNDSSTKN